MKTVSQDFEKKWQFSAHKTQTNYDFVIASFPGTGLTISFEYNEEIFDKWMVEKLSDSFRQIVNSILDDPKIPLAKINLLTEAEQRKLIYEFNHTAADYPKDKTIHQLFAEQAAQTPDYIALHGWMIAWMHDCMDAWMDGDGEEEKKRRREEEKRNGMLLSYQELNEQSDHLAALLIEKGIQADHIVGIMMERSTELIIGMLGILKAGAAYLPIDPAYPQERIDYMLKDSNAGILINKSEIRNPKSETNPNDQNTNDQNKNHHPRAVSVLNFENLNFEFVSNFVLRASNLFSSNLAYIIYTSGSTGKPKGVMIEHRNVARLVKKADFITFANNDKMLLTGAPVFDITTFEIWGPLLNNVPLVLTAEHHILNIDTLEKIIKINQVTLLHLVPQLFNQVAAQRLEIFSGLRYFWVGGDLVRPGYINELRNKYPHLKILHMYGPTENTTFSTSFLIDKPYESIIPIGKPVSNSTVFIMDADHNLQPQGLAGELYVGGGGLSRGYLNKPELTAEKFIPNPYSHCPHVPQTLHFPTGKLFKTGDLARWNASGNIEFLGRADYQVKVRGYRIELGEVESVLQKHTAVKDVVVIVVKDNRGENNICAYVVLNAEIDINELRRDTAHYLPSYMVPAYFVPLDKLPLNRNGKVDRKNLPVPGFDFTPNVQLVAPADDIEVRLLDIWRELLGSSALGVTHNFFQSGGHSLKAITLTAAIHKHMHVRVELKTIFAHPTIRELAHEIKQAEKCGHTDIGNTERKEYYDLSPAQKRLYVLYRFEPAGVAYNMARMFMLDGRVDVAKLEKAFNRLINRHESLRTSFVTVHGEPVQKVHETVAFTIKRYESCIDKIAEITNNFIVPFDLTSAPLLRAGLVRFSETGHLLMIDMHHIIADGISVNIFVHDFMHLYGDETLIPLKLQYTDFAAWQKEFYQTTGIQKQQTYWLAKFSDEPPVANLPLDYPRPQMQDFTGALFHFSFDELISKNLYRVAATSGTTLYMVLLAAFNTLLYRYMRQEDIITGTPVAGRPHADLEKITGLFINTLALRNHPRGEICFDNFLAEVKQEALEAFQNQDYQFEELIEHLKIPRQVNRNPLFDIMFTLQDQNELDFSIPGLQITVFEHSRVNAKFDLTLFAVNTGSTIQFQFEYPVDLFKKSTMARLAGYFMNTLKIIGNNPGISLKNIEIIGEAEKKELLFTFNNTGTGFQSSQTIRELFDACATANPTKRALIYKDQQVTYRQLHDHAAHVGRSLVEKGLKDNEIIGVLLDHSPNLIIALLGILEAGAAYLPMDIEYPGERIKYMMRDSACRFVIIDSGAAVTFPQGVEPVFMEQLLAKTGTGHKDKDLSFPMPAAPGAIAYQVYTSGSTGLPKGCLITQKGLVHYIEWAIKHYTPGGNACFPLFTSIAFDLTVTSIFTPLLSGNTVVAYPKHLDVLARVCRDGLVNIIKLTPTHLNLLLDLDLTQCRLQKIIVGGEQLTTELAQKIHDKFQGRIIIYNEYGPTETVVGCMIHQFAPGEKAKGNANGNANANGTVQRTAVPIGVPIQDTQVYVLDDNLSVCPIGVTGEIYIGGPGVSPGYNNRPALTNERFIANPFNHGRGSYLYKTGDLGLFLEDMRIEYVGREDRQVKIHGYRIEPGEIEHKIKTYPGIKDALVRIKENLDHEKYLCAYLLSPGTIKEKDLRNYLAQDFPIYMIPQFFITLPSFPISANGKIAEQLLPLPQKEQQGNPGLPVNHIQEFLYSVWTQFLPITNFTVQDNFFEIGGNSFLLLKMHHKISETYAGVQVTDYFKYPSIQALAGYITGCEKGENKAPVNQQSQQSLQCSSTSQDIAVIGVAFNLPRAHTIAELYDVLKNKTDCISSIPPNRIADVKNYLAYKGVRDDRYFFTEAAFLPTICDFDYTFFNISKNEAVVMDPYQRLFLETAWHVFEDAGYPNEQLRGTRTGVFLGQPHQSDYYKRVKEIVPEMALVAGPGNINSIIAGRVSYLLDLKGPSLVVDTACSSSLIALHLACRALKNGECDMALVGGINLLLEPVRRHSEELPNIASPTGRAKTFSDDADGTGQGEGVIGIVIKPYDRALADHDNIHAVIKGSAYNNDGSSIGITAPNGLRQEEVICAAWADAGIDPATISYIEAHGTGTILGDPIEVDSMSKAFAQYTDKKHFCGIGSIKTNYGHLDSAAGLLGLLKVIVSFRYRQLLPNVHFTKPNRKINFASSPVYVVDHLKEWTSSGNIPRRAGVSAFGLSGTNCHIVLEEPPLTGKKQNLYQDDRVVGRISIPLYPFEKKRCWLEIPAGTVECTDNIQSPYAAGVLQDVSDIQGIKIANSQQPDQVLQVIRQYIAGMFEIKEEAVNVDANYFDLGIDSISIIQLEHYVKKTYAADVTADELFDTLDTPRKLAQHIAAMTTPAVPKAAPVLISPQASNAAAVAAENKGDKQEEKQFLQRFVIKSEQTLTEQQKYHLDILEKKYTAKTGKSKAYSQSIRLLWANGRSIQGFTRPWKEFIYPIYVQEGQGVHIRDLDGNAYIDFAMGFGVNLLGYNHAVVTRVLQEQLEKGVVLGALTTLPGDVAALIHELTGVERVAFCNSGTESIMNLVRIARATTGKNKIALFAGSYHGTFDGVFVTKDVSTPGEHPIPRSLGIPNGMIDDVIILDYDSEKALDLIKAYAHELAAVLVEPVQSRNPLLQPHEFLQQLRILTEESGIALIFDEIITGFRIHPGGAQAYFNIQADLVAYGKVLGGGMPIGIFAGKAKYMDRVDGGMWNYHDDSSPSGFLVQIAGTFSHHPLAMAAAKAALEFLGPQFTAIFILFPN
ncbi:MAG: amino acid adenylation domain-containing protein [Acidobacteria bacterium]|nr:amino acid adenylation domain-containing protein [Acidobacteriota bacterium]